MKLMRRKFLNVLILLMCLSIELVAQNKFDEGFIINSQQDTSYGYIRYAPYKTNDLLLNFKSGKNASVQDISVKDIDAFGFTHGEYYEAMDLTSLENFKGVYFVKVSLRSEISLFSTSKGFILDKNNELTFLPLPSLIDDADVAKRVELERELEMANLLIMAKFLASDCQKTSFFVESYKTTERSLIRLTKAYNDCVGTPYIEYKNTLPWIKIRIGLLSGFNSSKFRFLDLETLPSLNKSDFESISSLTFGTEIKFDSPRFKNRFGASIGLHYQRTDYYGFSKVQALPTRANYNDIYINTTFIRVPIGLSYQVSTSKWPIILSAGVNFNNYLKLDYTRISQVWKDSREGVTVTPLVYIDEVRTLPNNQGFWMGIGTRKQLGKRVDLGLDFRYEFNNRMIDLKSNTRNIQFLISFIY
ncbi:MAG: hypothetical protein ACI9GZ_001977 [Bacteroidia bacterium]|jgi:hypothetical protein